MESPIHGLDNREFALLVWIVLALLAALFSRTLRAGLGGLARGLFHWKLLVIFGSMGLYVAGLVFLLERVHLWTTDLLSETITWYAFVGLAILFRSVGDSRGQDDFFKKLLALTVAVGVFTEFLVNLRPLNLLLEFLLLPVLVLLYGTVALPKKTRDERRAGTVIQWLIAIVGLSLIGYSVIGVVTRPQEFLTYENLLELLVPALLTLGLIPFVYLVALLTTYGRVFSLLNWKLDPDRELRHHAKWRAIRVGALSLTRTRRLTRFPWRVAKGGDDAGVDGAISAALDEMDEEGPR